MNRDRYIVRENGKIDIRKLKGKAVSDGGVAINKYEHEILTHFDGNVVQEQDLMPEEECLADEEQHSRNIQP